MQFQAQGKPPLGVVFDADLGNTIDSALALALLYGLQGKNESRVISVSTTKSNLNAAIFTDILVRYYTGEPGGFAVAVPIGLTLAGKPAVEAAKPAAGPEAGSTMVEALVGDSKFPRTITKMNETADPVALIRNALSAQVDQNAVVVLAGPATNLAALLALPGNKELVAHKARLLVVALHPRTLSDLPAARQVFSQWPTEIVVAPAELGEAVMFPGASIEKDFADTPPHPLVAAYRAYRPMPYDAPTVAMAAAMYAVRPQEKCFTLSAAGAVPLSGIAGSKHRTLGFDPAEKERVAQIYVELASTKPVGRPQRFRGPQKKQ